MKLGFFTMPLHPKERDYAATLREDRATILLAEELGFVEAFVGEHVTDLCETITSCLIFIASLAAATSRIRLGSATVNLPNTHPAAVAAQVAMVDTILEGRHLGGVAWLGSDLGKFPPAELGRLAFSDVPPGLRERRSRGRGGELARRQEHLRRR